MEFNLHHKINFAVADHLSQFINKTFDGVETTTKQVYDLLSPPPKNNMGDLAFPCFLLSKPLKKNPAEVAQALKDQLPLMDLIQETKNFGPYLNFYLNPAAFADIVLGQILDESIFSAIKVENAPKTIVEFSQPNTHKEMHVGHMRNLCLGDALVKLYRYAGVETLSTTFPGDVGTHVAKCLWYYKNHSDQNPPKTRKGAWLGTLYSKGNNLLEDQRGTDKEKANREELTAILKQLHAGEGEFYDLWKETRQWSIDLMQEVYAWADVTFDSWYWESDVDASSVKLVEEYLEKGLFVKDDGAVGIDLSEDKLGFCLLLKSDGTGLYATKDLELARRKFIDQAVDKSIYVVDNRQSLHFKQVFKTLEKMGFEKAKDCYHLQYEMVELTDGAMSSRKGNIVPLQALVDQMQQKIIDDYLAKYKGQWDESEINEVAHIVAQGAIKYGMTRFDSTKKIVFNMEDWLKLDGESGPYIQYVYARINSIIDKVETDTKADYNALSHQLEKDLINHLAQFNTVVESCVDLNKTHLLCHYLYHLAKAFNSFYAECSILKADSEGLMHARLNLAIATQKILKQGLALLGIKVPKRM